jgi:hypothetical protein
VAAASVIAVSATALTAGAASASTVNGSLTTNTPGGGVLNSGQGTTPFTVNPTTGSPPACTNTGPNGYQQFGYMIPNGDQITGAVLDPVSKTFSFNGGASYGFLLQDATLTNYGPENPGAGGVLNGSPTLQFNPSNATTDLGLSSTSGPVIWHVGVGCSAANTAFNPNPNPVPNQVVDNWDCLVTFTWAPTTPDGSGYTWTNQCGTVPTPEVPVAAALPLAGLGAAAVAFGGAAYIRRRRNTPVGAA